MKYREEQRYNDYLVYIILLLVGVLVITRVLRATQGEPLDIWSIVGIVAFFAISGATIWYLTQLRFTIRMNKKNLKIGYNLFDGGSRKIKWKNVQDVALLRPSKFFNWSGMNVHFTGDYTYYDLSGRGLLRLVLDDGEVVCVGVKKYNDVRQALNGIERIQDSISYADDPATKDPDPGK